MNNKTKNQAPNSKTLNKNKDIAEKLNKIGSLGKKTSKEGAVKRQSTQTNTGKPKKGSGVSLLGGLQDINRYRAIWAIMAFFAVVLFARAYWLQVIKSDYYIAQGDKLITAKRTLVAHRGMIYDTNGIPLAANAPLTTIIFSPYDYAQVYYDLKKKVKNAKSEADREEHERELSELDLGRLAQVSSVSRETLERAVNIRADVDLDDPKSVKDALPKGAGSKRLVLLNKVAPEATYAVTSLNFKGVFKESVDKRYYLQPESMAQILGYMGYSQDEASVYGGRAGVELKYNSVLAGQNGQVLTLRAVKGTIGEIKELSPKVEGRDIHLTIDSRLQYILYKGLEELGRVQSARSSSGMIVDAKTGDVLAMASWPSFNSNDLSKRQGASERNRPVLDTFEPGSVMKPFTVAAALESGKYSTRTLIDASGGSMRIGGYNIRDGGNYGRMTMGKLIQKSSNVASAKIALSLPADAIANMQREFGFGQKTALNFPSEASGRVDIPTEKDITRRATLSYGYGQSVTLAQISQAYATLANDGMMNQLRLVKNESVLPAKQIIQPKYAKDITNMMISVTEKGGTGMEAAISGYHVAGKTGTSRRAKPTGGYYSDQYRNVFAGFVPATNPRFVAVILVEDPRKGKYAGQTVAPVFSKVMKESLRLYNVPYDKPLDLKE